MLGVKMIEVANEEELREAIGPRTAMVSVLARAADQSKTFGLSQISRVAREYGVPVLVDAAAEDLTIPNVHLERGADLLAYSGGKALHGPQSTGLLIGRKDLIHAARLNSAPHGSFGRPMKVAKEDIMGLLAAVEMWPQRDHAAEWRTWQGWAEEISASVRRVPGVQTKVQRSAGLPQSDPLTALKWERKPRVEIMWDSEQLGIGGEEVFKYLYNDEPRIILRSGTGTRRQGGESHLLVVPSFMQRGDANVVAERLYRVLSNPPRPEQSKSTGSQASVAGRWELKIDFVYGSADHTLTFEQEGSDLSGEHRGEITTGDLAGWVDGNRIHFRDTHTYEAATFGYEFEGEVAGDTMQGDVGLGAYGSARWTAKRRPYA